VGIVFQSKLSSTYNSGIRSARVMGEEVGGGLPEKGGGKDSTNQPSRKRKENGRHFRDGASTLDGTTRATQNVWKSHLLSIPQVPCKSE